MRKHRLAVIVLILLLCPFYVWAQSAFQPYNTQGDNLIHIATADFDAVGAKDYVVGVTVEGKVIAFNRPSAITDPSADNRLWEYDLPCFAFMIATGDMNSSQPTTDEVFLPCTDGHLRILSSSGVLLYDSPVGSGAMYCADVGVDSSGQTRIVVGGVDGNIYFLNENGIQVGSVTPPRTGVIRRVVVGNFDGVGGDEVVSFYNQRNFEGSTYFEITDLDTMARPSYWVPISRNTDDVQTTLGWTDKQLPWAYDMDGDGDEEIVGHWGVLHPELGAGTQILSTLAARGELLYKQTEYENMAEMTGTGKYLLQQGVPGNFKDGPGYLDTEMFTLYGDDLYLFRYDTSKSVDVDRFRFADYGYAHTLYHFTDGARLENRSGGLDKMVLTGPINGDDHFYVVDLSGDQWKADAKTIDGNGVLGGVRDTLDDLGADIDSFAGTVATAGEPVWFVHYFASWLGWAMTPENIATRADVMAAEIQSWRDMLGGNPTRVNFAANLGSYVIGPDATDPDITAQGMVDFCAALAQHGVHFCLIIGHGPNLSMDAANLADCFEASVVDGECYMMARTRELKLPSYVDEYKPHMDAVLARADLLGVAPPKVMLCGKGAIFSAMSPTQAATYFPAYKDVMVLGVENSNVTVVDWSFSERAGMWLNGDVEAWGCNPIGDNLAANRVAEWGGMRNAHIVLRQMLSQYSMGADIFRVTSITNKDNPLYLRGDTTDPAFAWSNPYRQGIVNFLKIVESGVYPCSPERDQIKGVSPVAATLPAPNYIRLQEQSINHDYELYAPQAEDYVINNLACWSAYTDVPDFDATAILLNTKRRWENLFPNSPSGFVPMVPFATRSELEAQPWCNRAYETDGDTWSEFASLTTARDTISAELDAQKTNLLFYVENDCFWQITQQKNDPSTYFAILMDSDTLTPTERTVNLKRGSATGAWDIYDQFGSQTVPLGTLAGAADQVSIVIPAGSVRFLTIKPGLSPNINGDGNGDINFEDFEVISWHWLSPCADPDWCEGADLNKSGLVGLQDLIIFAQSWLKP